MSILSIQSHVSVGHVGNSAAVFPLQRLGWDVWPVNTVQFSNHPGYGDFEGSVTPVATIRAILGGIERRGALADCRAVLSGYIGGAALGEAILDAQARVHALNPEAVYVCDPVMGDREGGVYVADDIPDFMRTRAVPASDIALPNHFELELLSERRVETLGAAIDAANALRANGPDIVVVTSFERDDASPDAMETLLVTGEGAWLIETPRLAFDVAPNGAGDLTAALFTGHYLRTRDPVIALEQTVAAVFSVLQETERLGRRELALVAAQAMLDHPPVRFTARPCTL
jgi:pyridoxine kinase